MNIYLRELRVNLRSVLIWSAAIGALTFLTMAVFPSMANDTKAIEELIKQLPEGLIKAFGMDKLKLNEIMGYYATKAYLMVILFGGIFAVLQGSNILAKEESEKTVEFLLAKPVTRNEVVTAKALAAMTNVLLFNILVTLITYLSFEIYKDGPYSQKAFWLLALACFLAQLTFTNLGLLLSQFIRKKRAVLSAGIGLVLGTYFLSIMAELQDDFNFLGYFTPFKYASAVDIIADEQIKGVYLLIMLVVNLACLAAVYLIYNRKDIQV